MGYLLACKACQSEQPPARHTVREMMFGRREPFIYLECPDCGTLQLENPPADLAPYYPKDYYSFANRAREKFHPVGAFLKRQRGEYAIHRRSLIGFLAAKVQGYWPYYDWFRAAGVDFGDSILDVGAGRGDYLLRFASDGFTSLLGIDPYLDADVTFDNGVRVLKRHLHEMDGPFDCIFAHHSLEHMDDPAAALRHMHRLLRPGKHALISIPVAGSWAWRQYGVHWFQIDAPRHLVVPSATGMGHLARRAGFQLAGALYDSTMEQMTVSDAYQDDIPLMASGSVPNPSSRFTQAQLDAFRAKATALNRVGDGDQACFLLYKPAAVNGQSTAADPAGSET